MKKWSIVAMIIIFVITIYFIYQMLAMLYVMFPYSFSWVGNLIIPNPEKPEITYGEFPFQLVYELDGEVQVIEDTVICNFKGFELRGTSGKYRKWESRLKSGNERITLLKADQNTELYFNYGSPEFYMNDPIAAGYEFRYREYIPCIKLENGVKRGDTIMKTEEAWEKYKLKIIHWEYTPPIKNEFK